MPAFFYKVRNQDGELITGTMQGDDTDAVAGELFTRGYTPVEIRPEGAAARLPFLGGVPAEDLIIFSRQLATLVHAGISFTRSLDTIEAQTKNKRLKAIVPDIRRDVEGGDTFSAALARHPKIFTPLYVSMVKVGEEAGVLDEILERLSTLLEQEAATRAKVISALWYPMLVMMALVAAFLVLTIFVLPQFASLYANSRVPLPMPTRVLLWMNAALTKYWPLVLGVLAGAVISARAYLKTPPGRWNWDRFKLTVPIMGDIITKALFSRFSRIFSTLYSSGIPLLHSLDIVSGTLGNVILGRAVDVIKEEVKEGSNLSDPMSKSGVFPPLVVQMVAVGEETGALDEMLNKVSDYYDLEVEYALRRLSTTIEPVLIVMLAGVILFFALALFLPIWNMIGALKG